ncbi:MAG: ABC transporter permease [Bacillota bacterium]
MAVYYIFKRELRSYLVSPLAYAAGVVFLAISGYFFSVILLATRVADLRPYFLNLGVILLFVTPLLTMRLLPEERQNHTDELLMTLPATPAQVVVGKYLAAVGLYAGMLLLTALYPALLFWLSNPAPGPVLTSYLGALLLGGTFLAIGVFTSSLTDSQMVAGLLCFGFILLLWVINWLSFAAPGTAADVARQLAVFERFDDFTKGLIDSGHVLFYLSAIVLMLFLSVRSLERRTWM